MGTLRDEDLKLNIIVNGDKSKKELGELEQGTRKLINRNKELRAEKKRLEAAGKKETAEYKQLTGEMKSNNAAIKKNETRMTSLRKEIGVTGLTMRQLRAEQTRLKRLMDTATPGTPQWKKYNAELKKVETQMAKVRNGSKRTKSAMGKLADGFNKYFGVITAGAASFAGLIMAGRKAIMEFNEFEDQVADVMKTTGMAEEQVLELDERLQKINTRTAQDELLGLGRVAGKLGITGVDDVEGFVRAADKINVALSEDLGGDAEEAINQVGKLTDIFGVQEDFGIEQSMLKVGSAINSLGAASTANEGYLVEFAKRMAGVAPAADISIDQVLGLGATLDQFGQQSEVSSTTIAAVLTDMFKKPGEYAKIAGIEVQDFNKLMAEDSNEAFLKFLEGLNGNNEGLGTMARKLESLGLSGKRSVSVLGVLSNNTEALRKQQEISNREFEKGTSLQEEFNIKNETAQAKLEKAKKSMALYRRELGEKLQPVLAQIMSKGTMMMKVLSGIIDMIEKHGSTLVKIGTAIATYTALVKAKQLWDKKAMVAEKALNMMRSKSLVTQKAGVALLKLQTLFNGKLSLAQKKQIVATRGAMVAQKGLNSAMKANIFMAVATGIIMLVQHLVKLNKEAVKARINTEELNQEIANESREANNLFEVLKKTEPGSRAYNETKEKLLKLYPDLLSHYDLEKGSLNELEAAQKAVNNEVLRNVALQSRKDDIMEVAEKANKKFAKSTEKILKMADNEQERGALASMFGNVTQEVKNGTLSVQEATDKVKEFLNVDENDVGAQMDIFSQIKKIKETSDDFKAAQGEIDTFYNALIGNTTDYKAILGSIDNAESLNELEQYLNSSDEKIRAAAQDRKKIIEEFQSAKTDVDNAKSLEELEQYLQSENELVKKYAEKRKAELEGKGKPGSDGDDDTTSTLDTTDKKTKLDILEENHQAELVALKRQMLERNETQEWYNQQALQKEIEYLVQKRELQAAAGEDTLKTDEAILDKQIKLREKYQESIEDIDKAMQELENEVFELPEPDMEGFEEDYQKGVEALDRYKELKEKFKTDEESQAEQFTAELTDLKDAYELGIISHEDYEKRKADITKKYTGKSIDTYKEYLNAVGGIVNGIGDMFATQKEAELEAAGDNAAKKEAIEKKYAKKQKGIAKAQAAISAAQAIIQLWAQPSVIPEPANSIYKGIMAATILGTTAAQIKKINAAQFKSGGFTSPDNSDSKPAGIVHANEWVASAPLLRDPETRRHIDYLENVQRGMYPRFNTASIAGAVNRGFKYGGHTTPPAPGATTTTQIREVVQTDPALISTMQQMTAAANRLADKDVSISMSELNRKSSQYSDMQNSVNLKK